VNGDNCVSSGISKNAGIAVVQFVHLRVISNANADVLTFRSQLGQNGAANSGLFYELINRRLIDIKNVDIERFADQVFRRGLADIT
jgi:hypothetical protein